MHDDIDQLGQTCEKCETLIHIVKSENALAIQLVWNQP